MLRPTVSFSVCAVGWATARRLCTAPPGRKFRRIQGVKGMHDHLFDDHRHHQHIVNTAARLSATYGCRQVSTPIVEYADVFLRTLGMDSDVVTKEMFTFADAPDEEDGENEQGRMLALRPENTAGVVRAYVSHQLSEPLPLRYFYAGPMFRREKTQKGRYRQFHQLGIEMLGETHPHSDVEAISLAHDLLHQLGIGNLVTLHLHSMGDHGTRERYRRVLRDYLEPRKSMLSAESQRRLAHGNILRILDSKDETDQSIVREAPALLDSATPEAISHLEMVKSGLQDLGIPFIIDRTLVRGLDYYGHTVYEFVAPDGLGAKSTVLAGGRYMDLVEELGGPSVPGVGWAAGIERLLLLRQLAGVEVKGEGRSVAVINVEPKLPASSTVCLQLSRQLRQAGIEVLSSHEGKVKKQMARANRAGVAMTVLIGGSEVTSGQATVKNMATSQQSAVAFGDLPSFIAKALGH
eukprot:comp82676_c0_seq1/m.48420 comp82676_c0_seq1/g.48420  ORF comp82676_c0_seq1/g.48420 comp82676_c0_seq1/m.48420 type:complete len:464 (-) comp82676_c0_seq1:561-1952(-)